MEWSERRDARERRRGANQSNQILVTKYQQVGKVPTLVGFSKFYISTFISCVILRGARSLEWYQLGKCTLGVRIPSTYSHCSIAVDACPNLLRALGLVPFEVATVTLSNLSPVTALAVDSLSVVKIVVVGAASPAAILVAALAAARAVALVLSTSAFGFSSSLSFTR